MVVRGIGDNGGPALVDPLDEGASWRLWCWKRAHKKAWKTPPREIALRRLANAEAAGVSYREYTLEIMERGVYLPPKTSQRIGSRPAQPAVSASSPGHSGVPSHPVQPSHPAPLSRPAPRLRPASPPRDGLSGPSVAGPAVGGLPGIAPALMLAAARRFRRRRR